MNEMEVRAYLERIGYNGALDLTAETLRRLHIAHLRSVPFENLDIHFGRSVVLDEDLIFEKLVHNRRGGFCYELNGGFCGLLRTLGFSVTMLSAGVARKQGGFGPDFDHLALLVDLEEKWLADVGFGDSFVEPLLLDTPGDQQQPCGTFRIEADKEQRTLIRSTKEGGWEAQYRFTLRSRGLGDFREMCKYHQTSPLSSFTQGRIVSRATPHGRITLSGMRLIATDGEGRRERELSGEAEYRQALTDLFGIRLGAERQAERSRPGG